MEAAGDAVCGLDLGPGVRVLEQLRDGGPASARGQCVADPKAEPAANRVTVGGYDAKGAGIDAVTQTIVEPDRDAVG